jgi:uncharacterized protein
MAAAPRRFTRRAWLAGAAASGALLVGAPLALLSREQQIRIECVTIPPDADPESPRLDLAQLSDLHVTSEADASRVASAVDAVNAFQPDAVVLTGDYIWRQPEAIALAGPHLARLHARFGVYAVLGNHDVWHNRGMVIRGLEDAGVHVLVNRGLPLARDGAAIYLAGLDDGMAARPDLDRALAAHDGRAPVVSLFHEPDLGHVAVAAGRVWLQLSGHSHGGQVRLPGRGALILPPFAHRYDMGLYGVGPGWIYVNRGLGATSIPIRLNCPPEVTLLHVHPGPRRSGVT